MNLEAKLSDREFQITERFAWGQIDKEVADSLKISHHTVANHSKKIYKKTGVSSRGQLCAWYFCKKYKIKQVLLSSLFLCLVSASEFDTNRDSMRVRTKTSKSKKSKKETYDGNDDFLLAY